MPLDYLVQIDVAMVAPSRTGKTTLICAMNNQFNEKLNTVGLQFNASRLDNVWTAWNETCTKNGTGDKKVQTTTITNDYINGIYNQYKNTFFNLSEDKKFYAKTAGTREVSLLTFKIKDLQTGMEMPFRLLDYPGGSVASNDNSLEAITFKNYIPKCSALIVPVFGLALRKKNEIRSTYAKGDMDKKYYDGESEKLDSLLCVEDTCHRINEWCASRLNQGKHGILIFVPLKCECYSSQEDLAALEAETQSTYFTRVHELLRSTFRNDVAKLQNIRNLISVCYCPVHTFGTGIIEDARLEEAKLEKKEKFNENGEWHEVTFEVATYVDSYTIRPRSTCMPTPAGTDWLMREIVKFRNELLAKECDSTIKEIIDTQKSRTFFARIGAFITGRYRDEKIQIGINQDLGMCYKQFFEKFDRIEFQTASSSKVWNWQVNTEGQGEIENENCN